MERSNQAWNQYDKEGPLTGFIPMRPEEVKILPDAQKISFLSPKKSHRLLWGKLRISKIDDIPVSARGLFREICRVDGITGIQFGGIDGVKYHGPCKCEVSAHKNPLQIKGMCYDKGKYGGRQAFKIRVKDRILRDVVLSSLCEHLRSLNLLNRRDKP